MGMVPVVGHVLASFRGKTGRIGPRSYSLSPTMPHPSWFDVEIPVRFIPDYPITYNSRGLPLKQGLCLMRKETAWDNSLPIIR
jgi:hypothetical protein